MKKIDVFNSYEEACEDGCLFGVDHILLTMEHIDILLQGKVLKTDNYEYVQIIEIENMPNTAVEVVRCKDCKNRLEDSKMCAHPGAMGWDVIEVEDDDFCSYGERRPNG